MSPYAVVDVEVDGVIDETTTFYDETLLYHFISEVREDAEADGYLTRIFIQHHNHDDDGEECNCAQYSTCHHPVYTFNGEDY